MAEGGLCWSVVAGFDAIADSHGLNGLDEELEDASELQGLKELATI